MLSSTEIKTSLALGSIFAFRMLGLFMILPVFSIYATHLPYSTPTLIGLALGIYGLTQALLQLPFGIWSDFTSRKQVIFIGLIIFAIGSVLAGISNTIYLIILGRALQGAGAIGSSTIALVGDLTSEQNRSKAMAIVGVTIGISFVVAIILGPIFAHWIGVPGIFWLTAVFAFIGIWILWSYVPTPAIQHREFNLSILPAQLKTVFLNANLFRFNLSILISHAILTATFLVLPTILIHQFHFALNQQWLVYLPILLLVVLFIGSIMRRAHFAEKERRWILWCVFLIFAAQGSLLSVNTAYMGKWQLYTTLYFFFLGFTFLEALLPAMVSKILSADYRGTATGVFSSCQFLGIFLGGLWGGLLAQKYQYFGVFLGNTLLAFLWLIIMLPLWFNKTYERKN